MRFQIAQKLHAVSDPHEPPTSINDRARDIDLLLLRDLIAATGAPTIAEIRDASVAVFEARAAEAMQLGRTPRYWPPVLVGYPHWDDDYRRSAASVQMLVYGDLNRRERQLAVCIDDDLATQHGLAARPDRSRGATWSQAGRC